MCVYGYVYVLHLKLLHCNNPGNNCLSFSLQYILIKWYLVDVEMLLLSYTMLVSLFLNMSLAAAQITIDCLQLNFTSSVQKLILRYPINYASNSIWIWMTILFLSFYIFVITCNKQKFCVSRTEIEKFLKLMNLLPGMVT